jgi:ADP-heptose:LPS heptosyltransferase
MTPASAAAARVCMFSRLIQPGMGDLVQRNIFLSLIGRVYPNARLTWVLGAGITRVPFQHELVLQHSYADEIVICPDAEDEDPAAWQDFLDELPRRRFQVCVVDPSSAGLGVREARDAGISVRVAVPEGRPGDNLITHPMRLPRPVIAGSDLYDYAVALAQALSVTPLPRPAQTVPRLPVRPEEVPRPIQRPFVGVHPGGAKGWNRRWPLASYAELAARLVEQLGASLLILGAADEHEETARLHAAVIARRPDAAVHVSVGEPLNRVANLIDQLDLLIGNDSGPEHLAAALSTPTVVIYGPTGTESLWARIYSLHRGVNKRYPCQKRRNEPNEEIQQCEHGCPGFYESPDGPYPKCLTDIAVDEVWQAALSQLTARRPEGDRAPW